MHSNTFGSFDPVSLPEQDPRLNGIMSLDSVLGISRRRWQSRSASLFTRGYDSAPRSSLFTSSSHIMIDHSPSVLPHFSCFFPSIFAVPTSSIFSFSLRLPPGVALGYRVLLLAIAGIIFRFDAQVGNAQSPADNRHSQHRKDSPFSRMLNSRVQQCPAS
jgi:hypothetical protein